MLERLLDQGYRYAFVSNVDNLGAVLDPRILAWFAASGAPFSRGRSTGPRPTRRAGTWRCGMGPLVLRETAQAEEEDSDAFQDVGATSSSTRTTVDRSAGAGAVLAERGPVLGLPLIVNRKTVDPWDKSSPEVIQLETAMGAAIGVFDGAVALRVPRRAVHPGEDDERPARPALGRLRGDGRVRSTSRRRGSAAPIVSLSDDYKLLRDFDARFPSGPPSLVGAERLTVEGDVTFGADVVVAGRPASRVPRPSKTARSLSG